MITTLWNDEAYGKYYNLNIEWSSLNMFEAAFTFKVLFCILRLRFSSIRIFRWQTVDSYVYYMIVTIFLYIKRLSREENET